MYVEVWIGAEVGHILTRKLNTRPSKPLATLRKPLGKGLKHHGHMRRRPMLFWRYGWRAWETTRDPALANVVLTPAHLGTWMIYRCLTRPPPIHRPIYFRQHPVYSRARQRPPSTGRSIQRRNIASKAVPLTQLKACQATPTTNTKVRKRTSRRLRLRWGQPLPSFEKHFSKSTPGSSGQRRLRSPFYTGVRAQIPRCTRPRPVSFREQPAMPVSQQISATKASYHNWRHLARCIVDGRLETDLDASTSKRLPLQAGKDDLCCR